MNVMERSEEWAELEDFGFLVGYVKIKDGKVCPAWNAKSLLDKGFLSKGEKVKYTGNDGYAEDRDNAESFGIKIDDILTIKRTMVGTWVSFYEFEETEGKHNTVMFEEDLSEVISYDEAYEFLLTLTDISSRERHILKFIENCLFRLEGLSD